MSRAPVADLRLTDVERSAIEVALLLLSESIADDNDHLFPDMSADQIYDLARRFVA